MFSDSTPTPKSKIEEAISQMSYAELILVSVFLDVLRVPVIGLPLARAMTAAVKALS